MSAPKTNIEKQERRHRPVLRWIIAAAVIAVAAYLVLLGTADETVDEAAPAVQTDG